MAAKASITPAGLAAAPKAAAQAFMAASPVIKVGLPSSMATRVGSCRLTDPPSWPRWSVEPAPASDPGRACWPTRGPHASPTAPLPSYRGPCQVAVNRIGEGLIMQTHVLVAIVTLVALLLYFM